MSKKQKLDLTDFLTSPLRDEETTSIITNLFNRFLSEEQSVRINGQVGATPLPDVADITPADLDRELNALVPALYYKTGTEDRVFTFDDLVDRLEAIGVDTDNLRSMLAEQNFNFIPPINLDKFINYSSYYWAPVTNVVPIWNPDLYPEYYVMERPAPGSVYQMPVRVATTRDVKLWGKDRLPETITVTFSDATNFIVTGNQGTILTRTTSTVGTETTASKFIYPNPGDITAVWVLSPDTSTGATHGMDDPTSTNDELFTFLITTGTTPFQAGDTFTINITYITGTNTVAFSSSTAGKGFVSNIIPDLRFMWVDGLQLAVGDSVLVAYQDNPEENGIYTVTSTKWVRRSDANTEQNLTNNSIVFVAEGDTQKGYTFTLSRSNDSTFVMDDPVNGDQTWTITSTNAPSYLNEWQTFNFWVHVEDLPSLSSAVQATAVQAKRPIIEYVFGLELNKFIASDGSPSSSGTSYEQQKNQINQLPQFNLYRYDGTHAGKTSPIFFYVEDPDYPVDTELQKRLKTNANPDYIFSVGIQDGAGRMLFWKKANSIETIWTPGPNPIEDFVRLTRWLDEDTDGVVITDNGNIASVQFANTKWPGVRGDSVVTGSKTYMELRLISATNLFAGLGTYDSFDPLNPTTGQGLRILFSSNTNSIVTINDGVNTHLSLAATGGAGISFGGNRVLQIAMDMTAGTIMFGVGNIWSPQHSFPEIIGQHLTPIVVAVNAAGNVGSPQTVELRTKQSEFSGIIPAGYVPFDDIALAP